MGENTSSGPSCSSLSLALLISRQTNLERHFSPFILSTHFNMRSCNRCRSTLSHRQLRTLPFFIMYSISSFRPAINGFGAIHVPSTHHVPSSTISFELCGVVTFVWHRSCKVQFSNTDRTIWNHLAFDGTHHCCHKWCKILRHCFWLSHHVDVSPVAFPSATSTKYFSNFLGSREPSCLLPHELYFVTRSSSLQTPATHRTINAVHFRVADKGLKLRHLESLGCSRTKCFCISICNLKAFTQVLICGSILSVLNLLISRGSAHVFNIEEKSSLGGTSREKFGMLSILHTSEFRPVIFEAEVPCCSIGSCSRQIHCKPFTESQPRRTWCELTDWVLLWSHTHSTHSKVCTTPWPRFRWDLRPYTVVWVTLQSSRTLLSCSNVHLCSGFRTRDLCGLGICRREEPSHCACLTRVHAWHSSVPMLHKISLRDVSSPINSRNSRHHNPKVQHLDLPLPRVQQVSPDSVDLVSIATEIRYRLHWTRDPISRAPTFVQFSFPFLHRPGARKIAAPDLSWCPTWTPRNISGFRLAMRCSHRLVWSALTHQTPPLDVSKSFHIAAGPSSISLYLDTSSLHDVVSTKSTDPFHQSDCRVAAPADSSRSSSERSFHEPHDLLLEKSSAPTQHPSSCTSHVRSSWKMIVHCRISPEFFEPQTLEECRQKWTRVVRRTFLVNNCRSQASSGAVSAFNTEDWQHSSFVAAKEAIVDANFWQLSFLLRVRSTLRRCAMATPASVHCVSRQLVFGDLSCTGPRREIWHPRHHSPSTSSRIGTCAPPATSGTSGSSWIFWVWILRSYGFGNGRQQRDSESPDSGIVSVLFPLGFM